ncbi:MAG: VOC family protein [Pseudoxanthomonas suwonensis]|nr:VOC family protein [Pseudoxanthomonas suwonensis]
MQQQKTNPVVWFEIYVQDLERATRFYEEVLSLKLESLGEPGTDPSTEGMQMMAFPMEENRLGAGGALVKMQGVPSGGSTMVYFDSQDCAIELGRVEAAGGKVFKEKFSIGPHGHCGIGIDPDGNMFGVHSMK